MADITGMNETQKAGLKSAYDVLSVSKDVYEYRKACETPLGTMSYKDAQEYNGHWEKITREEISHPEMTSEDYSRWTLGNDKLTEIKAINKIDADKLIKLRVENKNRVLPEAGVTAGGKSGSKAIGIDELVVRDTKFLDADGNIDWEKWAPNGGRVLGTIKENQTIPAGTIIDRYGSQWGKYTSPAGVPYEQRALPYIENLNAYHKYEVLKPIDNVTISEIAPAFEQVGGGIQYELPNNIKKLKELGYIKEIK